jgi:hypothetical protein
MADKYRTIVNGKEVWRGVLVTPTGTSADYGRAVGVDPATGKINAGLVDAASGEGSIIAVTAGENIPSQSLVSQYQGSGAKVQLGQGTIARQVSGYVGTGGNTGESVNVQLGGLITLPIGSTGIVAADAAAGTYLYAHPTIQGTVTKTMPETVGQAEQFLGRVDKVGDTWFQMYLVCHKASEIVA